MIKKRMIIALIVCFFIIYFISSVYAATTKDVGSKIDDCINGYTLNVPPGTLHPCVSQIAGTCQETDALDEVGCRVEAYNYYNNNYNKKIETKQAQADNIQPETSQKEKKIKDAKSELKSCVDGGSTVENCAGTQFIKFGCFENQNAPGCKEIGAYADSSEIQQKSKENEQKIENELEQQADEAKAAIKGEEAPAPAEKPAAEEKPAECPDGLPGTLCRAKNGAAEKTGEIDTAGSIEGEKTIAENNVEEAQKKVEKAQAEDEKARADAAKEEETAKNAQEKYNDEQTEKNKKAADKAKAAAKAARQKQEDATNDLADAADEMNNAKREAEEKAEELKQIAKKIAAGSGAETPENIPEGVAPPEEGAKPAVGGTEGTIGTTSDSSAGGAVAASQEPKDVPIPAENGAAPAKATGNRQPARQAEAGTGITDDSIKSTATNCKTASECQDQISSLCSSGGLPDMGCVAKAVEYATKDNKNVEVTGEGIITDKSLRAISITGEQGTAPAKAVSDSDAGEINQPRGESKVSSEPGPASAQASGGAFPLTQDDILNKAKDCSGDPTKCKDYADAKKRFEDEQKKGGSGIASEGDKATQEEAKKYVAERTMHAVNGKEYDTAYGRTNPRTGEEEKYDFTKPDFYYGEDYGAFYKTDGKGNFYGEDGETLFNSDGERVDETGKVIGAGCSDGKIDSYCPIPSDDVTLIGEAEKINEKLAYQDAQVSIKSIWEGADAFDAIFSLILPSSIYQNAMFNDLKDWFDQTTAGQAISGNWESAICRSQTDITSGRGILWTPDGSHGAWITGEYSELKQVNEKGEASSANKYLAVITGEVNPAGLTDESGTMEEDVPICKEIIEFAIEIDGNKIDTANPEFKKGQNPENFLLYCDSEDESLTFTGAMTIIRVLDEKPKEICLHFYPEGSYGYFKTGVDDVLSEFDGKICENFIEAGVPEEWGCSKVTEAGLGARISGLGWSCPYSGGEKSGEEYDPEEPTSRQSRMGRAENRGGQDRRTPVVNPESI